MSSKCRQVTWQWNGFQQKLRGQSFQSENRTWPRVLHRFLSTACCETCKSSCFLPVLSFSPKFGPVCLILFTEPVFVDRKSPQMNRNKKCLRECFRFERWTGRALIRRANFQFQTRRRFLSAESTCSSCPKSKTSLPVKPIPFLNFGDDEKVKWKTTNWSL